MSKDEIVVLHMKEVIYTAIFVGLGIVLVILLLFMLLPKNRRAIEPTMQYTAGVYTSSVMMGSQSADGQVIVDENRIQFPWSVWMKQWRQCILMEPALENVSEQVIKQQSTEGIHIIRIISIHRSYFLNAIENALAKAGGRRGRGRLTQFKNQRMRGLRTVCCQRIQKKVRMYRNLLCKKVILLC